MPAFFFTQADNILLLHGKTSLFPIQWPEFLFATTLIFNVDWALVANVVLAEVIVKRNVRPLEHQQQLGLVLIQTLECHIEGVIPGFLSKDLVKAVA